MIVSQARIDANRRNARKSTGPRTPEGKERSRANALKHGLCASVVVPEDAQLVQDRAVDFFRTLRPQNDFHCWLVTQISIVSIRIDRAVRMERRVRDKVAIKAELTWDDDRRLEAELLGERLGDRPAVALEQLRRTPQGCDWLIARWAMLAHAADARKAWTPGQARMAFDLLATPPDFREGHRPGVTIDPRGQVLDPGDDPAAVARREIDELEARRELVSGLDEANRALAEADLNDDSDPELKRLRRHEAALHGRLRWFLKQLREPAPAQAPYPGLMATWLGRHEPPGEKYRPPTLPQPAPPPPPSPEAEAQPGRRPEPPFDLDPGEYPPIGQAPDFPKILANRREKQARKAEARREARRRKVEHLRA